MTLRGVFAMYQMPVGIAHITGMAKQLDVWKNCWLMPLPC